MGVFARLLRRSKATEEASTAEVQADTPTAESAAEEAAEAKGSTETKAEDAAQPAAADSTEADGGDGDDGVEIPKQQSSDEAADSEAGEGART
ncbi:hypothetical protein [Streptomyces sp. AS02]|uniref:hypothetical protein n=1 Tax=Streptomyces sp. AS02 TaxID=2938946 RepID=UPI002020F209|nr:hypothetical protein [Streptomyces sp. AS02]MCL8012962.1 hypothetical protein [Streptomyces sp. AS02]